MAKGGGVTGNRGGRPTVNKPHLVHFTESGMCRFCLARGNKTVYKSFKQGLFGSKHIARHRRLKETYEGEDGNGRPPSEVQPQPSTSKSTSSTQLSLAGAWKRKADCQKGGSRWANVAFALAMSASNSNFALSAFESDDWKYTFGMLGFDPFSRTKLMSAREEVFVATDALVSQVIESAGSGISFSMDPLTRPTRKVHGTTAHFVTTWRDKWALLTVLLSLKDVSGLTQITSAKMNEEFQATIAPYKKAPRVVLCTDNAREMHAFRRLSGIGGTPCLAHHLDSVTKKAASKGDVAAVLAVIRQIHTMVNTSSTITALFVKTQKRLLLEDAEYRNCVGRVYSLIKPCLTRWTTLAASLQRFLFLLPAVEAMVKDSSTLSSAEHAQISKSTCKTLANARPLVALVRRHEAELKNIADVMEWIKRFIEVTERIDSCLHLKIVHKFAHLTSLLFRQEWPHRDAPPAVAAILADLNPSASSSSSSSSSVQDVVMSNGDGSSDGSDDAEDGQTDLPLQGSTDRDLNYMVLELGGTTIMTRSRSRRQGLSGTAEPTGVDIPGAEATSSHQSDGDDSSRKADGSKGSRRLRSKRGREDKGKEPAEVGAQPQERVPADFDASARVIDETSTTSRGFKGTKTASKRAAARVHLDNMNRALELMDTCTDAQNHAANAASSRTLSEQFRDNALQVLLSYEHARLLLGLPTQLYTSNSDRTSTAGLIFASAIFLSAEPIHENFTSETNRISNAISKGFVGSTIDGVPIRGAEDLMAGAAKVLGITLADPPESPAPSSAGASSSSAASSTSVADNSGFSLAESTSTVGIVLGGSIAGDLGRRNRDERSKIEKELQKFVQVRDLARIARNESTTLDFWTKNEFMFPVLAQIARGVLGAPWAQVSIEMVYSIVSWFDAPQKANQGTARLERAVKNKWNSMKLGLDAAEIYRSYQELKAKKISPRGVYQNEPSSSNSISVDDSYDLDL